MCDHNYFTKCVYTDEDLNVFIGVECDCGQIGVVSDFSEEDYLFAIDEESSKWIDSSRVEEY